jgi:hypothetical protein
MTALLDRDERAQIRIGAGERGEIRLGDREHGQDDREEENISARLRLDEGATII